MDGIGRWDNGNPAFAQFCADALQRWRYADALQRRAAR